MLWALGRRSRLGRARGGLVAIVGLLWYVWNNYPHGQTNISKSKRIQRDTSRKSEALWLTRANAVKESVEHAWHGYKSNAYHFDDLKPLAKTGHNWMSSRATFYDSLDTLYIVGLQDEFDSAIAEIKPSLLNLFGSGIPTSIIMPVKTFEYHIRIVGGLLGAFMVSGQTHLLWSAASAADCILDAFDNETQPPRRFVRVAEKWRTPLFWGLARFLDGVRMTYDPIVWSNTLAGLGTFNLELRVLSRETGREKYRRAAENLHRHIEQQWLEKGRPASLQQTWATSPPDWAVKFFHAVQTKDQTLDNYKADFGSGGDSFYEYLLKGSLLDDGFNNNGFDSLSDMYSTVIADISSAVSSFVHHAQPSQNTFVITHGMFQSHLGCFAGGLIALGANLSQASKNIHSRNASRELLIARAITDHCSAAYSMTPTGLAPDNLIVTTDGKLKRTFDPKDQRYHLRPETVESLFMLYRITGDEKYRQQGWKIFEAIERNCRVKNGYVGITDVWFDQGTVPNSSRTMASSTDDDYMPSFFIGETLKYLFLLMSPDSDLLPMDKWIFNTEAHPLLRFPGRCSGTDFGRVQSGTVPLHYCVGSSVYSLAMLPIDGVAFLVIAILMYMYNFTKLYRTVQ